MVTASIMNGPGFWIMYAVLLIGLMYFMAIRPQSKEKKRMAKLMSSTTMGDSILTSSELYDVMINMTDDTVIVGFESDKNCRIPMQRTAIAQVEKSEV